MTRVRNGRNSKVMLFNHENGPKTVSPISLNDETTTESATEDSAEIMSEEEATTDTTSTTQKDKDNIDSSFQALLGLNEESVNESSEEEDDTEEITETTKNVGELLADLEKAIAQVDADYEEDLKQIEKLPLKGIDSEDIGHVAN